jgi:hypothetical protein
VWVIPRHHESTLLECEGFGGRKRRGQLKELIDKNRVAIFLFAGNNEERVFYI